MNEGSQIFLMVAPLALAALGAGFAIMRRQCAKNTKAAGLLLLRLTVYGGLLAFSVPFLGRVFGIAVVQVLHFALMLLPPFWLGALFALGVTNSQNAGYNKKRD